MQEVKLPLIQGNKPLLDVSRPLILFIENTGVTPQKAVLFGSNLFLNKPTDAPNLGSDPDIVITGINGSPYKDFLVEHGLTLKEIAIWRFTLLHHPDLYSKLFEIEGKVSVDFLQKFVNTAVHDNINDYISNTQMDVLYISEDEKSIIGKHEVDLSYDPYQFDTRTTVIHAPAEINGNTVVEIVLNPKRKIQLKMYPSMMATPERPKG